MTFWKTVLAVVVGIAVADMLDEWAKGYPVPADHMGGEPPAKNSPEKTTP